MAENLEKLKMDKDQPLTDEMIINLKLYTISWYIVILWS